MGIRDILKSYFVTGAEPTQEQFAELIDNLATVEEVEAIDFDAKFALLSPPITQQPVGGLVASGSTYTVTVVPGPQVGKSPTVIQWQQQSGSNWLNISGATSASYTTPTLTDTRTLRASLKNDFGTSYSDIVTVSVLGFSTQPTSGDFYVGNNVTLTAVANLANASYQWQEYDGSVWQNIADATAETLAISNLQIGDDGREFRCIASLSGVQAISNVAEVTVFGISAQPTEEVTLEGVADTYAVAVNQPTATYQWQRSTDGGTTWSDLAAETDSSLAVSGTQANNGRKYRCVVAFRGLTLTSNVVTRHVFYIATQPANVSVNEGQTATFTCVSSVPGTTYQLQRSVNNGSTWSDISGGSTGTYSIASVHGEDSGDRFRWKLSAGELELTSNVATLSANLLLDTYPGAVGVVSMRRRRTAYRGPVIKVRRSSDSAEKDFDSREVTDGTLTAWVGAGSGFVTTVYDQVGTNHATQTTASLQPRIVNSGSLEVNESGLSSIRFIDTSATEQGPHLRINPWYSANTPFVGVMSVYRLLEAGSSPDVIGSDAISRGLSSTHNGPNRTLQTRTLRTGGAPAANGSTLTLSKTYLRYDCADRTNVRTYLNTATSTAVSTTDRNEDFEMPTTVYIGSNNTVARMCDTQIAELLFFATDPSAYQAALRSRLVTEHSIT